jgi:hypothetical protein
VQTEPLVDDDPAGVTAAGHGARLLLVRAVVGEGDVVVVAVLLNAGPAARAGHARVDHAADGGEIAHLETGDGGPDLRDAAGDLVAGNAGVDGAGPLAARGMQVGVADAAEENVALDVPRPRLTTVEAEGAERRNAVEGCVGKRFAHDNQF